MAATLEAGENMTGVNFAAGKAFVISSTSGFVYVYDMKTLRPAGRIKIGTNIQLETATTDTKDEKIYLADSTENAVVIIDAKTEAVRKGDECRAVSLGHAHHGQQGQLLPLSWWLVVVSDGSAGSSVPRLVHLPCARRSAGRRAGRREHTRLDPRGTRVTQSQAETLTLTLGAARSPPDSDLGSHRPAPSTRPDKFSPASSAGPDAALVKVGQRVARVSAELQVVDVPGVRHAGDAATRPGAAVEATLRPPAGRTRRSM